MEKQTKMTLSGLIVTVIVISFVILIVLPVLRFLRELASKPVCGTNLKGLGTAMIVYGNDYDDNYPQLPGSGPWSKRLGFDYNMKKPDFTKGKAQEKTSRTITSSLYLLVREADVAPKSFICPSPIQYHRYEKKEFSVFGTKDMPVGEIVSLWDFGHKPHNRVSYAYQNPYGKYQPGGWLPASFALMADMSPWFSYGNIQPSQGSESVSRILTLMDPSTLKLGNSLNHELKKKSYPEGQNVLFADGHAAYEKQSNVGIKRDNIYTFWSTEDNPNEQDKQGGTAPTSRSPENDAKSKDDSFLVI